jgi:hypothetical protein
MKKLAIIFTIAICSASISCKDKLDIVNPNQPTPVSARNKDGLIALAMGGVYINGLQESKFGDFLNVVSSYHELMGDIVGSEPANDERNMIGMPDQVTLDDHTVLVRPSSPPIPITQREWLRYLNRPESQANPLAYEWTLMYGLNNAMNNVLENIGFVPTSSSFTEEEKNTLKAWCYFWKGFTYSRLGSIYCAGIINNTPNTTNDKFVTRSEILNEAESNLSKAETLLTALSGSPHYGIVMKQLIPAICQVGKGFPPMVDEWLRHINTFRARTILVNTRASDMTVTQWNNIIALTSNGVRQTDNTFTVRSDENGNLLQPFVYVAGLAALGPESSAGGGFNMISERLIQDFKPGDKRLQNNFIQLSAYIGPTARGTSYNTRYRIIDGGNAMPGVKVMLNSITGLDELYISASYEENILMLAEGMIRTGNIDAGLTKIDELRSYQGAGLSTVAGAGLSLSQALEELRKERRVGLAFRGFSFYDARRWDVLKNGRTACVVVNFSGEVSTNATIRYGFMEYWDVPVAELFRNPPAAGSAPVTSPE